MEATDVDVDGGNDQLMPFRPLKYFYRDSSYCVELIINTVCIEIVKVSFLDGLTPEFGGGGLTWKGSGGPLSREPSLFQQKRGQEHRNFLSLVESRPLSLPRLLLQISLQ